MVNNNIQGNKPAYDINSLSDGLSILLEIEDDTHRWITCDLTSHQSPKYIEDTLSFKYLKKLLPYVVECKLILEESEFHTRGSDKNVISEIGDEISYHQAVYGLMLLVSRIVFFDNRYFHKELDKTKVFIRFTWEAYIRYRLDSLFLNRYIPDERLERVLDNLPIFAYEEVAFFTSTTTDYIDKSVNRNNLNSVSAANRANLHNFDNNTINSALGVNVLPNASRRAFIPADSFLAWLSYRNNLKNNMNQPTKLISNIESTRIPEYWLPTYWRNQIEPITVNLEEKHFTNLLKFAGITKHQLKKLSKGVAPLYLGQATLLHVAIIYLEENLDLNLLQGRPLLPFL